MNYLLVLCVAFTFTGNTHFKAYMDYRCITDRDSLQYEIQQDCYTDDNGLRRYTNDEYVVAVGTKIANVGDHITVTLDTGTELDCIVGDSKGDRWFHWCGDKKNVVEFIVDTRTLDKTAKLMGDVSCISGLDGNIDEISE